jgi:hypothetical protein
LTQNASALTNKDGQVSTLLQDENSSLEEIRENVKFVKRMQKPRKLHSRSVNQINLLSWAGKSVSKVMALAPDGLS